MKSEENCATVTKRTEERNSRRPVTATSTWEQAPEKVQKPVKDAGIDRGMEYMEEVIREREAYGRKPSGT
jgi:hypothetical protein